MMSMNTFLTISRELFEQGKSVRFKVQGWSMRPFVRNGDLVTVSPVENSPVKMGDVVFYSTGENKVIVHRVVGKYEKNNKANMLIKGDACFGLPDRVDSTNVLGKVVAIERNGHARKLDTRFCQTLNLLFAGISPLSRWTYPIGSKLKRSVRRFASDMLRKLQDSKLYRVSARKITKENTIYQINDLKDSGYRFLAKWKNRVVGGATLTKFSENDYPYVGWWLFDMSVHWRYRVMGIGEQLTKMGMEAAAREGASEIRLLVFEDAKPAINLYRKTGFRQISIPELDKQLEQEAKKSSRRRIILARDMK